MMILDSFPYLAVARVTYTVLVEMLNPAQSINPYLAVSHSEVLTSRREQQSTAKQNE